jgi:tight adherence protein B
MPLLAVVGGSIPYFNLKRKQASRLKAFQAQLPEAIDMLVNAMKSGYSLQAALKFAGDEMPTPLGPEFNRVYDEQRLGMEMRNALVGLQERMDTLDCKMFVTALLLQRETGGNLAEVLGTLAVLMRERVGLRGHIETLTAEPKLSAIVLSVLPALLFFGVLVLNPDYLSPLWTTPVGRLMLLYAIMSMILGYIVLRKIGHIDI